MKRELTIPGSAAQVLRLDQRKGVEIIKTRNIGNGVLVTLTVTWSAVQDIINEAAEIAEDKRNGQTVCRATFKSIAEFVGARTSMEEEREANTEKMHERAVKAHEQATGLTDVEKSLGFQPVTPEMIKTAKSADVGELLEVLKPGLDGESITLETEFEVERYAKEHPGSPIGLNWSQVEKYRHRFSETAAKVAEAERQDPLPKNLPALRAVAKRHANEARKYLEMCARTLAKPELQTA